MGYDNDECAYCYAISESNVIRPESDDTDDYEHEFKSICHFCIGRLSNKCSVPRFINEITREKHYSNRTCFLCGTNSNSVFFITLCSSHKNEYEKEAIGDPIRKIYIVTCDGTVVGAFYSKKNIEAIQNQESQNLNFAITKTYLT